MNMNKPLVFYCSGLTLARPLEGGTHQPLLPPGLCLLIALFFLKTLDRYIVADVLQNIKPEETTATSHTRVRSGNE